MTIAQSMLPEFDHEMANTRKMLERLPEDKLEFKPDPKSMSLGRLAGHVAEMPGWGTVTIGQDELDLLPGMTALTAKSKSQLLDVFDKNVSDSRAALSGASDEHLMKEWKLKVNGNVVMAMPRIAVLRSMVMNHTIHHRAQLGVYYRMNGVPIPGMYGPSADEGNM
jgi:uncharacterized damage-inducible protein DinB